MLHLMLYLLVSTSAITMIIFELALNRFKRRSEHSIVYCEWKACKLKPWNSPDGGNSTARWHFLLEIQCRVEATNRDGDMQTKRICKKMNYRVSILELFLDVSLLMQPAFVL